MKSKIQWLLGLTLACSLLSQPGFAKGEKTFATPEAAQQALIQAVQSPDTNAALTALFGPSNQDLWNSGDAIEDKAAKEMFLKRIAEAKNIVAADATHSVLYFGSDKWAFPIPLLKQKNQWVFDMKIGREEVLNRRIGANELTAIRAMRDYVRAQNEYAALNPSGDGVKQYAQQVLSDPGKKNGLYWAGQNPQDQSPIQNEIIAAKAEGYTGSSADQALLYRGYYYKILKAQGKDAAGGAKDYVVNGKMTQGFALLAYPAKYNESGVMTFMVDQAGKVLQKNLGKGTEKTAASITSYNPNKSWKPAN